MEINNDTHNITTMGTNISNGSTEVEELNPPLYIYVYVSIVNPLIFFIGVTGNILVIQVVVRVKAMRKRVNYFLVNLSVADLVLLLIGMPVSLHEFYGKEKWMLGEFMCKLVPFLENSSHHCSVLTLLVIGFERYYAICHPLKETVGSRIASTYIMIPVVWVVSCSMSVPFSITSVYKETPYYDDTVVYTCGTAIQSQLMRFYVVFISVTLLALPLLLLTILYSSIIRTLRFSTATTRDSTCSSDPGGIHRLHQNNTNNSRAISSRRQVIRMMIGVMVLYFLCLVPIRCVQLWHVFRTEEDLVNLGFEGFLNVLNCSRILIFLHSAGNPVVYGLFSSNFRSAFKRSMSCNRSKRLDLGRHKTQNNRYSCRQTMESSYLGTNYNGSKPNATTTRNVADNPDTHHTAHFKPASTNQRPRSNSSSSDYSASIAMTPLLNHTSCVVKNTEVVAADYQQIKPGLAYV